MADQYNYSFDVNAFLETVKEDIAATPEPTGVMAPSKAKAKEVPEVSPFEKLKTDFAKAVQGSYADPEELRRIYSERRKADPVPTREMTLADWDAAAKRSADEVAQAREMAGITRSRTTDYAGNPPADPNWINRQAIVRDDMGGVAIKQPEPVSIIDEQPPKVRPVGREDMLKGAGLASPMGGPNRGSVRPAEDEEATTGEGLMSRRLDSTGETPKSFFDTGTFKLLEGVEGFKSEPYSLNKSATINGKPHKSGLTVGAGIDFGQHTRASLEKIGLPKTMLDKAESAGWIGLNPDTIIDPKTGAPAADRKRGHALMYEKFKQQKKDGVLPSFTKSELNLATPAMYKPYEDSAKKQMDSKFGEGTYDSLGEGTKAVLTLEKYHRGKDYTLPEAMLEGAMSGNPMKAAEGISWSSRRKNMKDWIKKVGLLPDTAPKESVRPKLRPEKTEE